MNRIAFVKSSVVAEVRAHASAFRSALELLADPQLPGLRNFPTGACGDSSRLLAQYFRELGLGDWTIVTAWRNERSESHAWLIRDGWSVDVTADQFREIHDPVVVVQTSEWHDSWQDHHASGTDVGLSYYHPTAGAAQDYERLRALLLQLDESV